MYVLVNVTITFYRCVLLYGHMCIGVNVGMIVNLIIHFDRIAHSTKYAHSTYKRSTNLHSNQIAGTQILEWGNTQMLGLMGNLKS